MELGVLRSFEFVSNLRRASVIVRTFGSQSGDIYVKGAPECMRDICRPDSCRSFSSHGPSFLDMPLLLVVLSNIHILVPDDYDEILAFYTHKGYRVIGCATRHLDKLSWVKAQRLKRDEAESNLQFTGFIIFENKLKPSTGGVIAELLDSNISSVMVTGDNLLTAISVARECHLIRKTAHCFVPRFVEGKTSLSTPIH